MEMGWKRDGNSAKDRQEMLEDHSNLEGRAQRWSNLYLSMHWAA